MTAGARPVPSPAVGGTGIPGSDLSDSDLLRELQRLHDTRHETLRHGSDDALAAHTSRSRELEDEYLRRWPQREIDPGRSRAGARARAHGD